MENRVDPATGEIIDTTAALALKKAPANMPQALMISPQFVQQQKQSLALLKTLVNDVLVKDRDYGHVFGIPGEFLWEPGGAMIISAFSCYVGHRRVLSLIDDGERIATIVEVPLLSFTTGGEVGTGIGAASTREVKHKYRWIENPKEWGYGEDAITTLKTKVEYDKTLYRIPNPEHGELLNIIMTIASKRAEMDAAKGLPGVSSTLREKFNPPRRKEPDWKAFWAAVAKLGLKEEEVHTRLNIASVNDWLKGGKSLPDAITALTLSLAAEKNVKAPTVPAAPSAPEPLPTQDLNIVASDPERKACIETLRLEMGFDDPSVKKLFYDVKKKSWTRGDLKAILKAGQELLEKGTPEPEPDELAQLG